MPNTLTLQTLRTTIREVVEEIITPFRSSVEARFDSLKEQVAINTEQITVLREEMREIKTELVTKATKDDVRNALLTIRDEFTHHDRRLTLLESNKRAN